MSSPFENQVVLITGATAGIGRATAIAFAQQGAKLVVSGRNAQAVGQATTRAVVSIIVALVVSDALITLICTQLGI